MRRLIVAMLLLTVTAEALGQMLGVSCEGSIESETDNRRTRSREAVDIVVNLQTYILLYLLDLFFKFAFIEIRILITGNKAHPFKKIFLFVLGPMFKRLLQSLEMDIMNDGFYSILHQHVKAVFPGSLKMRDGSRTKHDKAFFYLTVNVYIWIVEQGEEGKPVVFTATVPVRPEVTLGDYSYVMGDSDIVHARIGKFCSIAAMTRINPGNHPMQRASQSHFTYRASAYFPGESDEAAFPEIVRRVQPSVVLLNNLFRDQLDRYGELELVAERWRGALAGRPAETTVVVNADEPIVRRRGER